MFNFPFTAKMILMLQREGCTFTCGNNHRLKLGPMVVDENGVYVCNVVGEDGIVAQFSGPENFTIRCFMTQN